MTLYYTITVLSVAAHTFALQYIDDGLALPVPELVDCGSIVVNDCSGDTLHFAVDTSYLHGFEWVIEPTDNSDGALGWQAAYDIVSVEDGTVFESEPSRKKMLLSISPTFALHRLATAAASRRVQTLPMIARLPRRPSVIATHRLAFSRRTPTNSPLFAARPVPLRTPGPIRLTLLGTAPLGHSSLHLRVR